MSYTSPTHCKSSIIYDTLGIDINSTEIIMSFDKAKETAQKLKEESKMESVVGALSTVQSNKELLDLYRDNSEIGTENLQGSLPTLKIHYANQSKGNELPDGSEPNNGWFFHKTTQQQWKTLDVHILSISRGYRAKSQQEGDKDVFTQLMSGMIVGENIPFIFFVKGTNLSPMWEFGKNIKKYTKAQLPIPMFALTITLSNHQETSDKGNKFFIVDYKVHKNEDGSPVVVTDPGEFVFLRDAALQAKEIEESIVSNKQSEDYEYSEEDMPFGTEENA